LKIVIATGGGAAESQKTQELLRELTHTIYLNGNPETIESWLKERKHQPIYKKTVKKDMERRHKIYKPIAELEIITTPWDSENSISKILTFLNHGQV